MAIVDTTKDDAVRALKVLTAARENGSPDYQLRMRLWKDMLIKLYHLHRITRKQYLSWSPPSFCVKTVPKWKRGTEVVVYWEGGCHDLEIFPARVGRSRVHEEDDDNESRSYVFGDISALEEEIGPRGQRPMEFSECRGFLLGDTRSFWRVVCGIDVWIVSARNAYQAAELVQDYEARENTNSSPPAALTIDRMKHTEGSGVIAKALDVY